MNCFNLQIFYAFRTTITKRLLFSVIVLLSNDTACFKVDFEKNRESFEKTRETIETILSQKQPSSVPDFKSFFQKYDQLATSFFDKKNNAPLAQHVELMESELNALKTASTDPRYESVQHLLSEYHTRLSDLVGLLKNYIGSQNTLSCAMELIDFKHVLPEPVTKRGYYSLYWSLHHRLHC